jgi:hypothetical protein
MMREAKEVSVGKWQLDPYHTQVEFWAKHLGMMTGDFGLNFNMVLGGRMVVSDEIQVQVEGELVEEPQTAEAAIAARGRPGSPARFRRP